ncbi:putative bifunctional diguanylate cyclase/phosphodiesterase [Anderseniella sp. Alg231-50]|uniref:putative bifunctional diguanylate cyclase/phosphodiesterase n=1 Tax=Anderseniella sp. Alg231-50 TaxID=1922226 RepID=UPI00307B9DA3
MFCVGALLLVVGINFARIEINRLSHEKAVELAHAWSTQIAETTPYLPQLLTTPRRNAQPVRSLGNVQSVGPILGYRIYDKAGTLRVLVDDAASPPNAARPAFHTRITLPITNGGRKIGTIVTDVDASGFHDVLVVGAIKIGAIFSIAISFLLFVSLMARLASRQEALRNSNRSNENDSITGMPNQPAFLEMLATAHSQEVAQHTTTNLYLLNLDRFTRVNERLGNSVGNMLLRLVAERLRLACGNSVVCAHINGDTFGVIADETTGKRMHKTLQQAFLQPFNFGQNVIRLSASIGAATSTAGLHSCDELHHHAELALRAAKTNGGHQLVTYDSDTVLEFREIDRIAAAVEDACQNNEFELHYQPVVESRTRKLCSFEALLRLTTADGEKIGPDKFIPVAERIGRIEEIGLWTLREACKTVAGLPKHIGMAVNLSVQQFNSGNLVFEVQKIIKDTRVDPGRIELEVTEGIMIGDTDPVFKQLSELQALGIKIALDDFGTGYSSLNYLWRFTFDKLKVDQAFIRASDHNPKAHALLSKIVEVGRLLDMKVTAEGIETENHATRVADLGCDYSQGYLFGKAIPQTSLASVVISEFAEYIRRQTGGQADVDGAEVVSG